MNNRRRRCESILSERLQCLACTAGLVNHIEFSAIRVDRKFAGPIEVLPAAIMTVDRICPLHSTANFRRTVDGDRAANKCIGAQRSVAEIRLASVLRQDEPAL